MRVLIFTETLWPYGGGGELATYLYAKSLSEHGVEVKVIIRDNRFSELWRGLNIYRVRTIGFGKYFILDASSKKLLEELTRWCDIAYFTSMFSLIPLVKSFDKPIVVHLHSYFPLCLVGHLYNFYYKCVCTPKKRVCLKCIQIYESCRRSLGEAYASALLNSTFYGIFLRYVLSANEIVFVSKEQRKLFVQHIKGLSLDIPSSTVIYNPLPEVGLVPIEGCDAGFLGGLDPVKGFQVLLRAWLRIFRKFPEAKLRAAMTSSLPDIVEKVNVIRYPRLQGKDLEQFYRNVSIIIVPSICPETFGYVAIEALLRGRLLIASKVGGIAELVSGAPGVRLVPPGDVNTLAEALEEFLLIDRKSIIELGFKNREYVLRKFNSEASVKRLIRVFERAIANN